MQAEQSLILLGARTELDAVETDRLRTHLARPVDWDWLSRTARRHGVTPLLYRSLSVHGPDAVPVPVLAAMRDETYAIAVRNHQLTRELGRLLDRFAAHRVRVIPFKGPTLAATAYGDPSVRPFDDLDLLVRESDVEAARDALLADGFRLTYPFSACQAAFADSLTGPRALAYLRSRSEHHFFREHDGVLVDLHLALADRYFPFPLAPEVLFDRLVPVCLDTGTVESFCPEDLLLVLCLNGAKDCWGRLGRVCDVAELLHGQPDLNWRAIVSRARSLGALRMLRLGLLLARDLLDAPLPDGLHRWARVDRTANVLAAEVRASMFDETRPPGCGGSSRRAGGVADRVGEAATALLRPDGVDWLVRRAPFHLRVRERVRDRIAYCVRLIGTPGLADWMAVPLPSELQRLYYLLRPVRLAARYGLRLLGVPSRSSTPPSASGAPTNWPPC